MVAREPQEVKHRSFQSSINLSFYWFVCVGLFVCGCVYVLICLCGCFCVWVCLCASEEKEDEERKVTEFIVHGKERKKGANVKLIK